MNIKAEIPVNLEEEIIKLKNEKNAIILAHYYQDSEIQDIADYIGDSLDLSRKAKAADADIILFAGVKFMSEVAKILNPEAKVLIPDMQAGCSLEESCQPEDFAKFCANNPNHYVVSYINCSAEIKAMSDVIVTSSNAIKIVNSLAEEQKIIFAPDQHLGAYVAKETGRDMLLWQGSCIVHEQFSERELVKLQTRYPDALTIAHPECPEHLLNYADFIGSTSKLLNHVALNQYKDFIVLTEPGIIHQMKKLATKSKFYDVKGVDGKSSCSFCNECPHMKRNSLEKIYLTLKYEINEINLKPDLAAKAESSLNKMLDLS